jgi:hypothetical protein
MRLRRNTFAAATRSESNCESVPNVPKTQVSSGFGSAGRALEQPL